MGHGLGYGKNGPEKDAAGLLAAYIAHESTDVGEYVTCALQHAGIYALSTGMVSAQYGNPYSKSRLEVNNPLNNVFKSEDDKWVVLCLPEYDRDWPRLLKLIGREDLAGDADMASIDAVNAKGQTPQVVRILDEGFCKFTRDELLKMFKDNDIPCESAQTPSDIYEDENAIVNEYIKEGALPGWRSLVSHGTSAVRAARDGRIRDEIPGIPQRLQQRDDQFLQSRALLQARRENLGRSCGTFDCGHTSNHPAIRNGESHSAEHAQHVSLFLVRRLTSKTPTRGRDTRPRLALRSANN